MRSRDENSATDARRDLIEAELNEPPQEAASQSIRRQSDGSPASSASRGKTLALWEKQFLVHQQLQ